MSRGAIIMGFKVELDNALNRMDKFNEQARFTIDDMEDLIRLECKISKIDKNKVKLVKL